MTLENLREEMQATLDEEVKRSRYDDWDYDVDTWIEVLEMVLRRIDHYIGEEE
jgi:hypothetical protein|tara:strand:+ start:860 stop:1018 length:159 start_codon:yes stop_codon:yes gene_type:complete